MKVGIPGSKDVTKSFGRALLRAGHEVMLGSREAAKLASWVRENGDKLAIHNRLGVPK